MSKTAKEAGAGPAASPELPFEEALKRLETIVEAMEGDDLSLEALLARYEEGARLAQLCQKRLADAELKIQRLERNENGGFTLAPAPSAAGGVEE